MQVISARIFQTCSTKCHHQNLFLLLNIFRSVRASLVCDQLDRLEFHIVFFLSRHRVNPTVFHVPPSPDLIIKPETPSGRPGDGTPTLLWRTFANERPYFVLGLAKVKDASGGRPWGWERLCPFGNIIWV